MPDRPPYYLTTPIYYVNARPHIGTAYTTSSPTPSRGDKRALGFDTFFLTGTDEHGQKIERSAEQANCSPQEFTDQVSAAVPRSVGPHGPHLRRLHPHHRAAPQAAACRSSSRCSRSADSSTRAPTPASTASPTSLCRCRARRALPGLRTHHGNSQRRELLLQALRLRAQLLELYEEQSRIHPPGDPPQRSALLRARPASRICPSAAPASTGASRCRATRSTSSTCGWMRWPTTSPPRLRQR